MNSDKLKIGPHIFDILYLSKVMHDDGTELCGQCDRAYNKIEIEEGLPLSRIAETEMHEVLHGLLGLSGILPDAAQEELVVTALGTALTQFAHDNPDWLRRWIGRCSP